MSQELQSGFELSSDDAAGDVASRPFFSLPAVLVAYAVVGVTLVGLVFSAASHGTALVQPIDPNFHALMIGLGVFIGVLLAVFTAAGRLAGIGGRQSPLAAVTVVPLMVTALCGYTGSYAAERIVEWRAFHDITPQIADREFVVTTRRQGKSGASLKLQPVGTDYSVSLACGWGIYEAVAIGDHIILPVEIGRNGIERTQMPRSLSELRRG